MKRKEMDQSTNGGAAKAKEQSARGTPATSPEIDARIVSSFRNSYVFKTFLKSDSIGITCKDGIVVLSGTVSEESHKILAQETIVHLPEVIGLENKIATTAEIEAESADTWICRKVKLTLLFHFYVSATATTVEVKDRVVTLKGEATSMAQKELTTEYAADIEGVKAVINEMKVAPAADPGRRTVRMKMDDASIIAQVYTALLTHRSTNALKTKVEARNGEVSLTGIAKNTAEKALVTKIVTDINGVTSVNNEMTIDEPKTR